MTQFCIYPPIHISGLLNLLSSGIQFPPPPPIYVQGQMHKCNRNIGHAGQEPDEDTAPPLHTHQKLLSPRRARKTSFLPLSF